MTADVSPLIPLRTKVRVDSRRLLRFWRISQLGLLLAETNQSGGGIKLTAQWAALKPS